MFRSTTKRMVGLQFQVVKNKNRYFYFLVTGIGVTLFTLWQCLRRYGFTTDYARLGFLVKFGDIRTSMEPGAVPMNQWLPPHLRCDRVSYLDDDDCEIPLPPNVILAIDDGDLIEKVRAPHTQKRTMTLNLSSNLQINSMVMSRSVVERARRSQSAENVDEVTYNPAKQSMSDYSANKSAERQKGYEASGQQPATNAPLQATKE